MSDQMSEEFEAWFLDSKFALAMKTTKSHLWQAWQASRAALCVELPYKVECGDFDAYPYTVSSHIDYSQAVEAIQKTGVRVK